MSKLLSRAKVKLENANNNFIKIGEDDAYLDDCCYNLQQAIELGLKYIVEMKGFEYIETHDVRAQLNVLNRHGIHLAFEKDIRHMASILNDWEAQTRYNDSFVAVVSDIAKASEIAEAVIDFADRLMP